MTDQTVETNESRELLKRYIDRIENVESEISDLKDDVKDIYAEAKSNGFCPKTLRAVIKLRKINPVEREQQEALIETYLNAVELPVVR